jgi:carbon-monoxide dehydrogenase medium subunit
MPGDSPSTESTVAAAPGPTGYAAPPTLNEALALLAVDANSAVIAGGTDLVPGIRAGNLRPGLLVDLRRLPLKEITIEADRVRLGAAATFADILGSSAMAADYPALVAAAADVGGPPIRNRATIGGNLVNASPAADSVPPLLVYDATAVIAGPQGLREVPLAEFFEGPGRSVLQRGELLTEIMIPRPTGPTVSGYTKLGPRGAMAIAIVGVAVRITGDGAGGVAQCRIGLGAVAPTPIRAPGAEAVVTAGNLTPESIAEAAAAAAAACSPIDDIRGTAVYRRRMVEVLVDRLLTGLATKVLPSHVKRGDEHE